MKPKRKKLKSIPWLVNKASTLAQLWARMKDADSDGMTKCVTCGKVGHYKEMQGGHFIERGKHSVRLDQINLASQCPHCNFWAMKKASTVLIYRQHLVKKHGADVVEDLEYRSRQVKKWNRAELEDTITELKRLIEEKGL